VPEFLAAGPRDVLVAASDVHIATDVLRPINPGEPEPPSQMRRNGGHECSLTLVFPGASVPNGGRGDQRETLRSFTIISCR